MYKSLFIRTDLDKFRITSLGHQWIILSEWVPSEWESKRLRKKFTVIQKTPVDYLMYCKVNTVAVCHKTLNGWLESCGLLWCFCQLFEISFWRHPFTAEDTLMSKWCNVKFLNLLWWRNKLIYILNRLRMTTFSAISVFLRISQKRKFCHHLFTLMPLQTCITTLDSIDCHCFLVKRKTLVKQKKL